MKEKELFKQRDNLAESLNIRRKEIKELRDEFEESIKLKKEHIDFLMKRILDVRSNLYELGVSIEDC